MRAYVVVWAKPTPPHMQFPLPPAAFFSMLLEPVELAELLSQVAQIRLG